MTKKTHKNYLDKKQLSPNPENCTLTIICPLVEKPDCCPGCWHDKKEVKKRERNKNT